MQFALTYAPGAFDTRTRLMGRQVAGQGFLRAAIDAKPDRIWCYSQSREQAEIFGSDVRALTDDPPEMRFIGWDQPSRLSQAGILLRPDPGIADDVWRRQATGAPRSYSVCGLTHTLSSHAAMSAISDMIAAPCYEWDALICTSKSAQRICQQIFECQIDRLRQLTGAFAFGLPRLPVIPLGVHIDKPTASLEEKSAARIKIGIRESEFVVLFVGRLTFHGKAHPIAMFLALQEAALKTNSKIVLVLSGQFPHRLVREAFLREAASLAPAIRLVLVDGAIGTDHKAAWSSADVFASLADNIQETFGLTPVEAMAAGLPVVVSDWDGYKDTVQHGVEGFRVPTYLPPPGSGENLATRYDLGLDNYDYYIGGVSQFTAVDIGAAAEAFAQLIISPELRWKMGQAGRRRAVETYQWSVVFGQYIDLWADLHECRRSADTHDWETRRMCRSDRQDPFTAFSGHASNPIGPGTMVRQRVSDTQSIAVERLQFRSVSFAEAVLPTESEVMKVLSNVTASWTLASDLLAPVPSSGVQKGYLTIAWLLKMGVIEVKL